MIINFIDCGCGGVLPVEKRVKLYITKSRQFVMNIG